jgi:type II secretory pathway component PulF
MDTYTVSAKTKDGHYVRTEVSANSSYEARKIAEGMYYEVLSVVKK